MNGNGQTSKAVTASDAAAIEHFRQAVNSGRHWFLALLESMGLWASAEELYQGRTYRYLLDGEAFDWLLLAERLCTAADGLLPEEERNALLFSGKPPLNLDAETVEELLGSTKYRQYLNFFYGVTVEQFLLLAAQEESNKEKCLSKAVSEDMLVEEAFERIYEEPRGVLLKKFRRQKGYRDTREMSLTEHREFTYWLFKYRVLKAEKARVASDTRKALNYLQKQRAGRRFWGALVTDGSPVA